MRLNLQAVQAVNKLTSTNDLEDMAYKFMTTAYTIFEEEINETDAKVSALNLITTTLFGITCFGTDNFDTLCANCISYNGKLLKKNLQAEATNESSHIFYYPFRKAGNKLMNQLRKALKIAETCLTSKPENLYVLVEILSKLSTA